MSNRIINGRIIGDGHPAYIIGEIGINHNGDVDSAIKLIKIAKDHGFDAVKFQKRTPEICVPEHQKSVQRETPWGSMSYFDYKKRIEFEEEEYKLIDEACKEIEITWFASAWDLPSIDFLEKFNVPVHKVASASITDTDLMNRYEETGKNIIMSTGMSTMEEIKQAASAIPSERLLIAHSTSSYPCKNEELNLNMIKTLKENFDIPVGYSGHDKGIQTTVAAVVLGATHIERHITLSRTMWGTDQAASLEPRGMEILVRDIRIIEEALGDGVKKVYDSEIPIRKKLRGV